MPKIVTRQTRISEVNASADRLAAARNYAANAERDGSEADRAQAWADVATEAGAVQRRARQLAGLGRGG